jgi:hypothetical protein
LFLFVAGASAQVAVQIGQNFTGSTYFNGLNNGNSAAIPPDPNGAVGPKHFVEFINGSFTVYNKTNGQSVQRISDVKFWQDAGLSSISTGSGLADPRIIYDPVSHRWFASQVDFDANAAAAGRDYTLEANDFLLAVSTNSDPRSFPGSNGNSPGSWRGFIFQADPDSGDFADFPTLGLDSIAVYVSGDMFHGLTNAVGAALVSIPKADLLAGTPTIANLSWFGVMNYTNCGQVLQPVTCFDGTSSGNILAVGDVGSDGNAHSNLVIFAVQNAAGPGATLTPSTVITVSPYIVPFNFDNIDPPQGWFTVPQPDDTTTLAGNDARFSARVYAVGGVIYAVHSTELNGRMAIRWYRISATNDSVLEAGVIADPDLDLFFPSIAANSSGTVVIGCNGSSTDTNVSCYAIAGQTVNGVTTFGNRILLQPGGTSYHGDDELYEELYDLPQLSRWGDYSTLSVDPADPTRFWSIQMFPPPSDFSDVWSTQITELLTSQLLPQLRIAPAGTNVMVSWSSLATGYQLQSATNLAPSIAWSNVTQTTSTNGGTISVLVPVSGNQKYFRLQK